MQLHSVVTCVLRTAVTHRFIQLLRGNRLPWNSSLQCAIVDSECRVVAMDALTVCTKITIAYTFIVGILTVAGIIGNSLTFVVFWKGNFKSSTSFLFLSLSLIDSAVLLTAFACCIVRLDFYIGWLPNELSVYLKVCVWPVSYMTESATIWLTVLVAVNRYIIVCRPFMASQWCTLSKVKIQLAVVLVLVVLYNIPQIVRNRVVHITVNNGTSYVAQLELMGPRSFPKFYNVYDRVLAVIVLVCLPLCILTFLTIRLIKAMKVHHRMQSEMQSQHSQPDNSMTFALVIVVTVFIICRAPLLIWKVLKLLGLMSRVGWCCVDIVYYTLLASNSAVNVIIYIIINRRFRNVLFANVCRRRSAIPEVTSSETVDTRL